MIVKAWLTATQVQWHGEDDYTETHGWVDERWSMTDLMEYRSDVSPVGEYDSDSEDDREDYATTDDFIRATCDQYLGAWHDDGEGTFYAEDSAMSDHSLTTGIDTTYALHFTWKTYDHNGWVEYPVTLTGE